MVNDAFCAPCQLMLAANEATTTFRDVDHRPHHADGPSFRHSLDLGCAICIQFWIAVDKPESLHDTAWRLHEDSEKLHLLLFHDPLTDSKRRLADFVVEPWMSEDADAPTGLYNAEALDVELSHNTGSESSFAFIRSSYQQCLLEHQECAALPSKSFLPTRLLDVGPEQSNTVSLVDSEQVQQDSSYVTLSHCWGQVKLLKLTDSSVSALRHGVPDSQLPKTFRDAVKVTRKMGQRYIWIDSLCIFQDKIDDWSTEATSMKNVYQFAAFNIAATAAKDGDSGMFRHREPREINPFNIDVAWTLLDDTASQSSRTFRSFRCAIGQVVNRVIDISPLNLRAWVIQERYLSRRIIHYSSKEAFWECNQSFSSETSPNGLGPGQYTDAANWRARDIKLLIHKMSRDDKNDNTTNNEFAVSLSNLDRERLFDAWYAFRYLYSGCSLTYWEDRFVAFKGIAQTLETLIHDKLVAGLWSSRLLEELCWRIIPGAASGRCNIWVAPSWSWVSSLGLVEPSYHVNMNMNDAAQVVDLKVQTQYSGALVDGTLTLQCRPVAATLKPKQHKVIFDLDASAFSYPDDDDHLLLHLDTRDLYRRDHIEVFLVILRHSIIHDRPFMGSMHLSGVILVRSDRDDSIFERVGSFNDEETFTDSLWSAIFSTHEQAAETVVTIE